MGVHTKTHKYENDMYQNDFIESVIYLLAHTKTHYYIIKHIIFKNTLQSQILFDKWLYFVSYDQYC